VDNIVYCLGDDVYVKVLPIVFIAFICHAAAAALIYALLMYLLRKHHLIVFCCPFAICCACGQRPALHGQRRA
jgi:hypothetical protein